MEIINGGNVIRVGGEGPEGGLAGFVEDAFAYGKVASQLCKI